MRAVAATEPGYICVVEIPVPEYGEYECLLKTEASGFCSSTDMKIIEGDLHNVDITYPLILGHEGVGRVTAVGSKVKNASIGQRYMFSTTRIADGTKYRSMWAGMAEYSVMKDSQAMIDDGVNPATVGRPITGLIPDEISSIDGTGLLTVAENYSALKNFTFSAGQSVLIYGDGAVGFGIAKIANLLGAGQVVAVGHHDDRLDKMKKSAHVNMCINTHSDDTATCLEGHEFDLVVDAVGKSEIILEGAQFLKPGGRIGAYGVLHRHDADINLLDLPNHVLLHMLNFPYREFDIINEMVPLVLDGKIDLGEYYSHVLPVEDCFKAMKLVQSREALKAVLTF